MGRRHRKGLKRPSNQKKEVSKDIETVSEKKEISQKPEKPKKTGNFYERNYKLLLLIPMIILVLAILQISIQTAMTGDFVNKGVTLKGGSTATIRTQEIIDISELEDMLSSEFPGQEILVRSQTRFGEQEGYIIDTSIQDSTDIDRLEVLVRDAIPEVKDYSIEHISSTLGQAFFIQIIRALIAAFLFMGAVVFIYFGEKPMMKIVIPIISLVGVGLALTGKTVTANIALILLFALLISLFLKYSIPSFAVILSAFTDIVITVAIVNLLGIKLSTAGIAAFLMLIGYSVDTDILLSTKLFKRKEGTLVEKTTGALKTGLMISATTIVAITLALILTQSETIRQIMIILFIGLVVDLMSTWVQNLGVVWWYIHKKEKNVKV